MVNKNNFIERLKKKDEKSLDYIIDTYLTLVKGVVRKVLVGFNDMGLIEECINDVFLNVWKYGGTFKGEEERFKYWICKIAKMKAIDYYRKRIKICEDVKEEIAIKESYFLEEEVIKREENKKLYKIIEGLSNRDKEIFIMKYFLGLKSKVIGEKKGLSETAVNNRISRAKKKIKEDIQDGLECEVAK